MNCWLRTTSSTRGLELRADLAVQRRQVDQRIPAVMPPTSAGRPLSTTGSVRPLGQRALGRLQHRDDAAAVGHVGPRHRPLGHALAEVLDLGRQRLAEVDLGNDDVAGAGNHLKAREVLGLGQRRPPWLLLGVDRLAHDALVVEPELGVRRDVVVDEHLLAADHRRLAHLVGVQPAALDVAEHAAVEVDAHEHDVLDAGLEVGHAAGAAR